MPVPTTIADLSTTASNNSPASSDSPTTGDDYLRAIQALLREGDARTDVASATTTAIGASASRVVRITGTTTITGFGTISAGIWRIVTFEGALTLTHNATSLILPGNASITTAAGDSLIAESLGSGNWIVHAFFRRVGSGEQARFGNVTADADNWISIKNDAAQWNIGVLGGGGGTLEDALYFYNGARQWILDSAGRWRNTNNSQSRFYAHTSDSRTTDGDYINYTEVDDVGAWFNPTTGVATTPVAGVYSFSALVYMSRANTGTDGYIQFVTSDAATYPNTQDFVQDDWPAGFEASATIQLERYFAAGVTVKLSLVTAGGAGLEATGSRVRRFTGRLVA